MLQSLLALPLGAGIEVILFLLLYRITSLNGKQAAVAVLLVGLVALLAYSLLHWPGADVLAMYVSVLAVTACLLGLVSSVRERQSENTEANSRWFHWAPAVIVIFFVVLFAADSVFVMVSKEGLPDTIAGRILPPARNKSAVTSAFPGVVSRDFHKKETLYNDYLAQADRQGAQGWQIKKGWLGIPVAGEPVIFQVSVMDKQGIPLRGADVSGIYQRSSDSRLDRVFSMQETGPGNYQVELILPAPGVWSLELLVRLGEFKHELHAQTSVQAVGGS